MTLFLVSISAGAEKKALENIKMCSSLESSSSHALRKFEKKATWGKSDLVSRLENSTEFVPAA